MAKPTVMIVDDDPSISAMLNQVLMLEGYPLEFARNGEEAIAQLQAKPHDRRIMLLDLTMPVIDGWGVVRWLIEHPQSRKATTVILMSAAERLRTATDLEHEGELAKPFNIDMMLTTIEPYSR